MNRGDKQRLNMNIDLNPVINIISQTGRDVRIKYDVYNYETTDAALDLKDSGIIEDTTTKVIVYQLMNKNCLLCKIKFLVFINEETAYISDLFVNKKIRNNGIGSTLRNQVVEYLEPKTIYSFPTNDIIKKINKEQGFRKVNNKNMNQWYVRY